MRFRKKVELPAETVFTMVKMFLESNKETDLLNQGEEIYGAEFNGERDSITFYLTSKYAVPFNAATPDVTAIREQERKMAEEAQKAAEEAQEGVNENGEKNSPDPA